LDTTAPERLGQIKRSDLLDIQGRSRSRQIALAKELGVTDYPAPAGGCLLTDPHYSKRLADLFNRRSQRIIQTDDPILLFVGRHIVLPEGSKLVVGRNEAENNCIEGFSSKGPLLAASELPGPTALIEGQPSRNDLLAGARLTAGYGKGKTMDQVEIHITQPNAKELIWVSPERAKSHKVL
jgi:hypothetical protein